MPDALPTPCSKAGCPKLSSGRFCPPHEQEYNRQYNKTRRADPNKNDSFYSSKAWRKARAQQLKEQPLCEDCLEKGIVTPATIADHKVPRSMGGADFDKDNLRSSCKPCHDRKSIKEGSRFGKQKRGVGA